MNDDNVRKLQIVKKPRKKHIDVKTRIEVIKCNTENVIITEYTKIPSRCIRSITPFPNHAEIELKNGKTITTIESWATINNES